MSSTESKIIDADFAEIERRIVAVQGILAMEERMMTPLGFGEMSVNQIAREMWDGEVLGRMVRPYKPRQQPQKQDHSRAKVKAARAQRRRQKK